MIYALKKIYIKINIDIKFLKKNYYFKRVNLARLSIKFTDDIHEYSKEKSFFKHLEYSEFKSKLTTKSYLKEKILNTKYKKSFWWAIVLGKKCIGTICVKNINLQRKSCEIAYGLNPKYWNKGYFKETLKGLSSIIICKNRFIRCQVFTAKSNRASLFALKKCGFKLEGTLEKYYYNNVKKKHFDALILSKIC